MARLSEDLILDLLDAALPIPVDEHPSLRLSARIDAAGIREVFTQVVGEARSDNRGDADWLSCNGSDAVDPSISRSSKPRPRLPRDQYQRSADSRPLVSICNDHFFRLGTMRIRLRNFSAPRAS